MLMALLAITGTAALKTTNSDLKISSKYRTGVASLHLIEAAAVSKCAQKQLNSSLIDPGSLTPRNPNPRAAPSLIGIDILWIASEMS